MRRKAFGFLLAFVALIGAITVVDGADAIPPRLQQQIAETSAKLGLNGDQKQRFEALHTRYVQQRFDLVHSLRGKSGAGAARTLRAQLATIDRQEDQELTAVLSPQQLAQFQALRQQNREQLRARLKDGA